MFVTEGERRVLDEKAFVKLLLRHDVITFKTVNVINSLLQCYENWVAVVSKHTMDRDQKTFFIWEFAKKN